MTDTKDKAMTPITMQDVRLIAGEGKLSAHDVLAAVNAHLRLHPTPPAPQAEGEIEATVIETAIAAFYPGQIVHEAQRASISKRMNDALIAALRSAQAPAFKPTASDPDWSDSAASIHARLSAQAPAADSILRDARRYRRLQILGCAVMGSKELSEGLVSRFTNLDAIIDADISLHPSRGEAEIAAAPARTYADGIEDAAKQCSLRADKLAFDAANPDNSRGHREYCNEASVELTMCADEIRALATKPAGKES